MIELTDQFSVLNEQRLKSLVELAKLRQIPLHFLMDNLGLEAPPVV
ncbi:MAG: hypothetical protein U9Q70_13650 [Chloroflexota bacterium]|nr:hypothetical protein [Chloroflexota bacterium]